VKDGKLIATLEGHEDDVSSASFTPDGKYILSGSYDKSIRLWDRKTGKFIKMLARQNRGVASLSISPDGKMVLTGTGQFGTGSYTNNVFSIPSGNHISQFDKHTNIVLATAISPDGKTAATGGGNDREMYLWDITTGREKKKMVGKGRGVWSTSFSKDGRTIAWGNTFKQSSMFGYGPLEKSFIISTSTGETGPGPDVTNDSSFVRAIEKKGDISIRTKDGKVHPTLQILKKGKVVHEITRDLTSSLDHRSLTLTPDGKTVISGGAWGDITAYDIQTGKELRQYIGHTSVVWGVAVSPDGRLLVSGSADQTVKL
jgi:WD40 repeat protein